MKVHRLLIALIVFITMASCSCNNNTSDVHPDVIDVGRVNVDDAISSLTEMENISAEAQELIRLAIIETQAAKAEAKSAQELVKKLKAGGSPHTAEVEALRKGYETKTTSLETKLKATQRSLETQKQKFAEMFLQLEIAQRSSKLNEQEKLILRKQNGELKSQLAEAEKYKEKYHKLTKYKWIVWGLAAWIVIKFLGGLGAWSPQGRVARALIG